MIGHIVFAWLLADFIAGFWHWAEDRYFDENWIWPIGEYIAKPNHRHHREPNAFLEGGYWKRNWTTILPASTFAILCIWFHAPLWLTLAFVFASQANEIHAWSHSKGKVNKWIELGQETGILQSPRHHSDHHRSPFRINYCVMSNWLNPWLDHFAVWDFFESLLARVGVHPREASE